MRPSSLRRFTKRGFQSTDEIEESRLNGGINLLASELDVSLQEAAGLIREVQGCLSELSSASGANTSDIVDQNNIDDDNIINSSPTNAQHMLHDHQHDDGILTAYDLLHINNKGSSQQGFLNDNNRHVVTFCKAVDKLLGGGVSLGQVTEISGLPGTGKTQLGIQLSVLARLPRAFGGVEGRTLYVDAEGSFVPERAYSMADALCDHVHATTRRRRRRQQQHSRDRNSTADDISSNFTIEHILDSIDVFRVHDETALLATLYSLRSYVEKSQQQWENRQHENQQEEYNDSMVTTDDGSVSSLPVKLIVIDSIAFHFRAIAPTDSSYYVQRTKTLTSVAAYLGDLASKHDVAIVVINQMTTKINNYSNTTTLIPALGESWAHATATRLLLSNEKQEYFEGGNDRENYNSISSKNNNEECYQHGSGRSSLRQVELIKSAHRPTGTAPFRILEMGIRDVKEESMVASRFIGSNGSNKRPRPN